MHEDLMDQGVAEPNLARARAAVKRNRGAAGIDRMTVDELEVHWQRHGAKMRAKLVAGRWTPSPVRRVEIPKPNGGTRQLGIPTVMDRVVQQALLQVLQPIFDPRFSESSYGFRPRRSAHDAVRAAQSGAGRPWERKFLGFRINRRGQREVAPQSVQRCKQKVREIWRSCRSVTSRALRDEWRRYVVGWWGYYRLAQERRNVFRLEGWIRRHMRKCFWLRWHGVRGRQRALRRLGVGERLIALVPTRRGAWFMSSNALLHKGLSNAILKRYGLVVPSNLAACG